MSNMEFAGRMDRFETGVFPKLAETEEEKTAKGEEVIDLSIRAPNIPPAPHVMETLYKAAAEPSNYVHAISDRKELPEAVKGWYNIQYGVELDPETETCPPLGSQEGLAHITLSVMDEGGVVLVPDPCYPALGDGPQAAGTRLHYMPQRKENGYIIRLDEIPEDAVRKIKFMVASYPNNPITAMAPDSFYEELIDFARKYNIIALHDNAYNDLVFNGKECGSFLRFPGTKEIDVEFNSLSKTYGPIGTGTGFCLDNSQVASRLKLLKSNMDYGISLPVQTATIATIIGDRSYMQVTKQAYEARGNAMCGGFTSTGWKMGRPGVTMFVWAVIPEHYTISGASVMELVKRVNVMVTPDSALGPSGKGYMRLALIQDEEVLNRAIRTVRENGVSLEEGKR